MAPNETSGGDSSQNKALSGGALRPPDLGGELLRHASSFVLAIVLKNETPRNERRHCISTSKANKTAAKESHFHKANES